MEQLFRGDAVKNTSTLTQRRILIFVDNFNSNDDAVMIFSTNLLAVKYRSADNACHLN